MDTQNFTTSDINLAAFCIVNQVQFVKAYKRYANHFIFVLSDKIKCLELEKLYLNNGLAQIRSFLSAREMLMSQIKARNRDKNIALRA